MIFRYAGAEPDLPPWVYTGMNTRMFGNPRASRALICSAGLALAATLGAGCGRGAVDAPPPDQVEVIPAPPEPDFIWVGGYWDWSWGRYVWVGGHYEHPAHPHDVWVRSRWERRGDRYVRVEGHWR
jgi:hypothetical protein